MSRKRISIILLVVGLCFTNFVKAQEDDEEKKYVAFSRALNATDQEVVKGPQGVGWVRSHFLDDWFLQTQGGGQLYYGTDDRQGPFGDRLTGNIEFQAGRRIFPMFGFRFGAGMGYARGFLTKEKYNNYLITTGGNGQCGTDANGTSLGGYYWDYNNDLLIQKWKYWYFGADIFLDLAIFRGTENYNPFRRWNHILYTGVHTKFAKSEEDTKNHRSEAHIGYICKLNLDTNWSIYADVRGSAIERLFDREWISSIESSGFGTDKVFNFQIGVMYKFHIRTEEERHTFTERQKREIDQQVRTISTRVRRADTVYTVSRFDTTMHYEIKNIDSPDMQRTKDSLLSAIDERNRRNQQAWEEALKEILLNQLLPYEMVFFELDKWDILPEEEMKIEKMARIMKAYPNDKFILTGSADSKTGTVKRNEFLSHQRADVVYNILVNQYNIEPERLERVYLGGILEYQPFQLNRTTVIIMDHPVVKNAFEEMKKQGKAGGNDVNINE